MPVTICPCDADCYCGINGNCGKKETKKASAVDYRVVTVYATRGKDGGRRIDGLYTTEGLAHEAIRSQGVNVHHGDVTMEKVIQVGEDVYFLLGSDLPMNVIGTKAAFEQRLRNTALAKLTPEERRVLGLGT